MQIGRKTWHRKAMEWFHHGTEDFDSMNLCKYFWMTLVTFVLFPVFLIFKAIVVISDSARGMTNLHNYIRQTFYVLLIVFYFLLGIYTDWVSVLIGTGVAVGLFLLIIFGIAGGSVLKERYDEKHKSKKKKSNITLEWIKAKKGKYCPRIEWTD